MKNRNMTWSWMVFGLLAAMTVNAVSGSAALASPARKTGKDVVLKIEPIPTTPDESAKKQEDRISAVNRALDEALAERAKSQSEYDRQLDRLAARSEKNTRKDARESRLDRDLREESRREKRLNWLND